MQSINKQMKKYLILCENQAIIQPEKKMHLYNTKDRKLVAI